MDLTSDVLIILLSIIALLGLVNLATSMVHWIRHDGLTLRITRIESELENRFSHREANAIHERLAAIEGRLGAQAESIKTIQEHLLESEK